jgi:hypothetical protein
LLILNDGLDWSDEKNLLKKLHLQYFYSIGFIVCAWVRHIQEKSLSGEEEGIAY